MYLGFSQDQEAFDYFRRHFGHFFPALVQVDRSNWQWQATNLLAVKERLWCLIRDSLVFYDSTVAIVDSMLIQVCQFFTRLPLPALLLQALYLSSDL